MAETPAGIFLVDKPAGVTSHDVVAGIRRELGGRKAAKVGHAGTLDPFATGLLLVLTGRATRLQQYLMGLRKTYEATARLGWTSSTGDRDGELAETGRVPGVDELALPTGKIKQRLPMTSAVHVDGERLYKKAHRGEEIETPEREVEVYSAELLEHDADAGRARYRISCSAGTYIRTLVETLGDAYCEQLRRTAIGPLKIERAGETLTPNEALAFMPEYRLAPSELQLIENGRRLPTCMFGEGSRIRLVDPGAGRDGDENAGPQLVAVAVAKEGEMHPEVVLRPASP